MLNFKVTVDEPKTKRKVTIDIIGTVMDLLEFAESLESVGEYGLAEDIRNGL